MQLRWYFVSRALSLGNITQRRITLGISAIALVPLGLILRFLPLGLFADLAGGVLYAALIYVLVAFLAPRLRSVSVGVWTLVWCVGVELLQLSSIPQELAQVFAPIRLVLGTSFAWLDLLAYLGGTILVLALDRYLRRKTTKRTNRN